jgi:lipooligosaccharide transport system ATP-binding protein
MPGSAISLRGVVKRYGEITAVDGLDLEVPEGTCVGLLGPNGAGKSTTMRMLTAQAIADEGDITVLGHVLPGDSKAARAECGVVPAARQPRHHAHRGAEPARLHPPLPDPAGGRREAIERALETANLSDRRDTRRDKLSGACAGGS